MRCPFLLNSLLILGAASAFAQQGDRKGEAQAPLAEHIRAQIPAAPVRSPEEEAATFSLAPGFRAELVAAEPLVVAPVAAQFGADGRLWVVEMPGFMPNADGVGERAPVGAVVVLDDVDHDGRYDRRTVFADQLVMPRALSLVDDGVLVAEPPHLWFFRDTNGDGKADEKTAVADDYGGIENPEHTANGLMWAMDNWIYSANHTVRFRYEGEGKFARDETITRGQWGITQDDFGRIYYNSNSDPLRIDALPAEYLRRNPAFEASGANVRVVTPKALRLFPARVTPGVNRGYQILDDTGKIREVTAACGPVIYRGALFPAEFRGDAFIAEPAGNLVKRIKLTDEDGVVSGANAYDGFEFMASTDERFRPVNLLNGPDGALYVVDFYRGILQHRIYLTSFLREQVEARRLDQGLDRGRIWRIVPENAPRQAPRFAGLLRADATTKNAATSELVAALRSPNGWTRDVAQRLLVEQRDAAATRPLRALAIDPAESVAARLHALWTLDGAGFLDRSTVLVVLADRDPRVCVAALRLAEAFVRPGSYDDAIGARVAAMRRPEPEVRRQLALTLGQMRTAGSEAALLALVRDDANDPWLADAAVSGLAGREAEFIAALAHEAPSVVGRTARRAVIGATEAVLKSGDGARIERVLRHVIADTERRWLPRAVLAGVRQFLPKTSEGKLVTAPLPAEPKALVELAARTDAPGADEARELLPRLTWPGKPGADPAARGLTTLEQAQFERGKAQYAALCAACHQANGQGLPGLAPSLVHSKWVLGDARILARIVLNGKATGNLAMPPWKSALDDEAIAAVLTFLRRSWGHEAEPVAASAVAGARAATAKREQPFTDPELDTIGSSLPREGR